MRFMFLLYSDEAANRQVPAEQMRAGMEQMFAYRAALVKAQAFVEGAPLMPTATARTVRVQAGQPQVLDGPYAETREQLGGYFIIEAASLDEAHAWAARCPAATWGIVEVRPVRDLAAP